MLKIEELRIGNLILVPLINGPGESPTMGEKQVKELHHRNILIEKPPSINGETTDYIHPQYCEGVPLTEDWLNKLGFEDRAGELMLSIDSMLALTYCTDGVIIEKCYEGNPEPEGSVFFPNDIKYVHQLQNLYYTLTGEELIKYVRK